MSSDEQEPQQEIFKGQKRHPLKVFRDENAISRPTRSTKALQSGNCCKKAAVAVKMKNVDIKWNYRWQARKETGVNHCENTDATLQTAEESRNRENSANLSIFRICGTPGLLFCLQSDI